MMLVVIPVCQKDYHLALKSLDVAIHLDQKTEFEALVAYDSSFDGKETISKAQEYFSKVHTFQYDPPPKLSWPQAANHAWQSVARHIKQTHQKPWLWLEPDVTPIRAKWLNIIYTEYTKYEKPFMGHIVDGMGHMNGVGIYPFNVSSYSVQAFLTESYPFDRLMWPDIEAHTHKANHLFAHYPRFTGIRLTVKDKKVPERLSQSGFVLFHGCNDGTLANLILGKNDEYSKHRPDQVDRIYEIEDINAPVDESEPFWQHEATSLKSKGFKVIPYQECTKHWPSIKKQADCHYFDLPKTFNHVHLNGGLCFDGRNYWLATRQWTRSQHLKWQSYIYVWKLDSGFKPTNPIKLPFPDDTGAEQFEDPRISYHDGKFWVSYCIWQQGTPYRAKQRFSCFDHEFRHIKTIHLPYGKNNSRINLGEGSEKNWVWFFHENAWHFVYQAHPHVVVQVADIDSIKVFQSGKDIPDWRYGEMRGGTPPVRVGDEYITFFHSSLPWRIRQKRYYMGAYAFSATAPFNITRITKTPLLGGSEDDCRELGGPLVAFPCGAVFRDDQWIITGGVNDEACFWMRLKHKDLKMEEICSTPLITSLIGKILA